MPARTSRAAPARRGARAPYSPHAGPGRAASTCRAPEERHAVPRPCPHLARVSGRRSGTRGAGRPGPAPPRAAVPCGIARWPAPCAGARAGAPRAALPPVPSRADPRPRSWSVMRDPHGGRHPVPVCAAPHRRPPARGWSVASVQGRAPRGAECRAGPHASRHRVPASPRAGAPRSRAGPAGVLPGPEGRLVPHRVPAGSPVRGGAGAPIRISRACRARADETIPGGPHDRQPA